LRGFILLTGLKSSLQTRAFVHNARTYIAEWQQWPSELLRRHEAWDVPLPSLAEWVDMPYHSCSGATPPVHW